MAKEDEEGQSQMKCDFRYETMKQVTAAGILQYFTIFVEAAFIIILLKLTILFNNTLFPSVLAPIKSHKYSGIFLRPVVVRMNITSVLV